MASTSGQKQPTQLPTPQKASSTKKKKSKDGGVSSDEERWLDALESGKLEEMDDELKKIKPKDPKLMTARQRAMYERGTDNKDPNPGGETLLALPSGYKEKVMTAEALQKAALKSQKRKQQADEKREKDKKKTMERILKKQESKQKNSNFRPNRNVTPLINLKRTNDITTMSFHSDVPCPIEAKTAKPPKPKVFCAMDCGNLKKYSCSQTGVPLCSLECYRKNISSRII